MQCDESNAKQVSNEVQISYKQLLKLSEKIEEIKKETEG